VSRDDFLPRTQAHSHTKFSAARTSHARVRFAKILIAHARVRFCVCVLPKFAHAQIVQFFSSFIFFFQKFKNWYFQNRLITFDADQKEKAKRLLINEVETLMVEESCTNVSFLITE
jgi:hypothetical protein